MINFIITYWCDILCYILFTLTVILFGIRQRNHIKEWLLFAVIEAEKQLGSKTGKIKLRQVFDWFINTFPIASKFVSFNNFSNLVDVALDEMAEILENNKTIKEYVEGEE